MRLIGRRQCDCTCPGTGTPPTGTGLPSSMCSACANLPCAFDVDFGCNITCDGLTGGGDYSQAPDGTLGLPGDNIGGLLRGKHITRLYKDGCSFESHCRYTARDYTGVNTGTGTGDCSSSQYSDVKTQELGYCGWYDRFSGCDTVNGIDSCTKVRWDLQHTDSSATLIGYSDSGTVTYQSHPDDPWVCPTPGVASTNRLWMTSYPDSLSNCKKFPQMVCVSPAFYGFNNPCDSDDHRVACCDSGANTACFRVTLPDCGVDVIITAYRNGAVPGDPGSQPETPSGACGFFWGYNDPCPGTGSSQLGILAWCDGTNWKIKGYCWSAGVWTKFCDTTATLNSCCPTFNISFTCPEIGTGSLTGTGLTPCCCTTPSGPTVTVPCCPSNPIPETLTWSVTSQVATPCPAPDCPVGTTGTLIYSFFTNGTTDFHVWANVAVSSVVQLNATDINFTCRKTIATGVTTWTGAVKWSKCNSSGSASQVGASIISVTCSPYLATFRVSFPGIVTGCAFGNIIIEFAVTP